MAQIKYYNIVSSTISAEQMGDLMMMKKDAKIAFLQEYYDMIASSTTSAEQMGELMMMKKKGAKIASLQKDIKKLQEAAAGNSAAEGDNNIDLTANLGYSHDGSGETDGADDTPLVLLSQHFAKMELQASDPDQAELAGAIMKLLNGKV